LVDRNAAADDAQPEVKRGPRGQRGEISERILSAGRLEFAAHGYAGTTLRAIANHAGVDPTLITYYFGGKQGLFRAALEPPSQLAANVRAASLAPLEERGRALIEQTVAQWEDPAFNQVFRSLILTAAHEPLAMSRLQGLFKATILASMSETLEGTERELRASLVSSQIIGVIMARYIWRIGALAKIPACDVARHIAPTLQAYLTEPLTREP
jgi:AcrR family transcriptional regulator